MTQIALSRRARKKEETRRRIFQAAVRLFRERGFEATTIDEITERADVAKGTFFNYYPRKEAVLGYLSEARLSEAEENAGLLLESGTGAREKVIALYAAAARGYEEDRALSWFVIMEGMKRAFTGTEEVHQRWHQLVARLIREGQAAGEVRSEVAADRAASVLGSVYMGTLVMWLGCASATFELQDELRRRLVLVFDGLAD